MSLARVPPGRGSNWRQDCWGSGWATSRLAMPWRSPRPMALDRRDDGRQPHEAGPRRQRPADEQQGCRREKRHAATPAELSGWTRPRDRGPGDLPRLKRINALVGVETKGSCETPLKLVEVSHQRVLPGADEQPREPAAGS